jgi:hypothetical protein
MSVGLSKWYDCIEPEVRELVYLLRNNGWNTVCSCEHAMTVQVELQKMDEMEDLATFLIENGAKEFEMSGNLDNVGGGYWRRWCEIHIVKSLEAPAGVEVFKYSTANATNEDMYPTSEVSRGKLIEALK